MFKTVSSGGGGGPSFGSLQSFYVEIIYAQVTSKLPCTLASKGGVTSLSDAPRAPLR